ncbi:MAG TPA: RidA family protein [Nannocystis exedens]|nr:RidA family protein [Nannocystis exedens]
MVTRKTPYVVDRAPVFSWYRDHAGLIYTSGHAAVDIDSLHIERGDLLSETRATLTNLRRTLEAAGSSLSQVLKVTVYLTDMSQYNAFNSVYAQFFPSARPPARTCVEVTRLPFNFKVEVEVIAACGQEKNSASVSR